MSIKKRWRLPFLLAVVLGAQTVDPNPVSARDRTLTSSDAYVTAGSNRWAFGTSSVERVVALERGWLITKSFKNKRNGANLTSKAAVGHWALSDTAVKKLAQGELQLDVTLSQGSLEVTRSYVVYPGSSIIREWSTFRNVGKTPLDIKDPEILNASFRLGDPRFLKFNWMTGGMDLSGSWDLKIESLEEKPRIFDSYDPFPAQSSGCREFPGPEVPAKILWNDRQIWPAKGWEYVPNATGIVPFDLTAEIAKGDQLKFSVNSSSVAEITAFDPKITYQHGETHEASKGFSNSQGRHGWRYRYVDRSGEPVDLTYNERTNQWNVDGSMLFVGEKTQRGGFAEVRESMRVWTAEKSGRIHISGHVCNLGTSNHSPSKGFKPGSATYAPWVAFYDRTAEHGLFIGWDYFGRWQSSYALDARGAVLAQLKVAGHRQTLAPGETLSTPQVFVGLFIGDLDDAGNELLDWQYQYLWDYTREGWFPGIRVLGNWYKGTGYLSPGVSQTEPDQDISSAFRKVFRVADFMRYVGADVYHRDWGWWDLAGDWNGPDFRQTGDYLRKHGMGQLLYVFPYVVDLKSAVARKHPEWLLKHHGGDDMGVVLDMSRSEVVSYISKQLDSFVGKWGDFEWRNDSAMTAQRDGDDTVLLGQDQGMRTIIRSFLDRHPGSAFQGVNAGGNYAGYDYARYSSALQITDGAVGLLRNHWASLLFPPDKTTLTDGTDERWNPDDYRKTLWRGLLSLNFDLEGDTWKPSKLEGLRELVDLYHYLQHQGVVGRWVRVYRPIVSGDDERVYFQRLSRDAKRGIIIPKRPASGPVTIRPKGLIAAENYLVSFHESDETEERGGAELMARGITIPKMRAGELIYLNLPQHPGTTRDKQAPTPPTAVRVLRADNLGFPGIEVRWNAGSDDNWISYYEVFRNGRAIDRVAKGTFYFDHSAGADLAATYEISTVDGSGNVSRRIASAQNFAPASQIVDDADGVGLSFTSQWERKREEPLVTYRGTITTSDKPGAAAELTFEGKRVLWFTKMGPENGKVAISIDGKNPDVVDTYSADIIWGAGLYRKEFPSIGRHTIRIEVLAERNKRSRGSHVFVDGLRVEMQ